MRKEIDDIFDTLDSDSELHWTAEKHKVNALSIKDINHYIKWPNHLSGIHEIWNHLESVVTFLVTEGIGDGTQDGKK